MSLILYVNPKKDNRLIKDIDENIELVKMNNLGKILSKKIDSPYLIYEKENILVKDIEDIYDILFYEEPEIEPNQEVQYKEPPRESYMDTLKNNSLVNDVRNRVQYEEKTEGETQEADKIQEKIKLEDLEKQFTKPTIKKEDLTDDMERSLLSDN